MSTPFLSGQTVEYDIVVTNLGPCDASNVVVGDTPTGFNITSTSAPCAGTFEIGATCTIPSITTGAPVTITVTGTVL